MTRKNIKKLFIIISILFLGSSGVVFAESDNECEDGFLSLSQVKCYLKLLINQNQIIIEQNEKILTNQKVIICQNLFKSYGWGYNGNMITPTQLLKGCGNYTS